MKSTAGSARVNPQSTPGPIRPSARKSLSLNNNCSGTVEDLMKQKLVSLDAVDITVLDEADHMAD